MNYREQRLGIRANSAAATRLTLASPTRHKVLVVEDNRAIAAFLSTSLDELKGIESEVCDSYQQTKAELQRRSQDYFIAVLDLNLPDAPDGQVVDLVQSFGIPVVVLTGSVDESVREKMLAKNIADYVYKHHVMGINHVVRLVERLYKNRDNHILIVDDSASYRLYLRTLLNRHGYNILEAEDGVQGLKILKENPSIRLVVTDYNIPNMDGLKMAMEIRKTRTMEDLAIIGVSDTQVNNILPTFLKSGASDFLHKPFSVEEFFCRIDQNLDMVRYVQEAKDAANRDFLTKLYNRRYFFEHARLLHFQASKEKIRIAAAMIDADHFKSINDKHGHSIGDEALIALADVLKQMQSKDCIVARYGGEEFSCVRVLKDDEDMHDCLEALRHQVEQINLMNADKKVPITVSIGYTENLGDNLDKMLDLADEALYKAKENGRNRVERL